MNNKMMRNKSNKKQITIESNDDFFGAVLNCAVRYCIGRKSYMPGLVIDKITPWLPMLSDKTLWCFERDIKEADSLGDEDIDAPRWRAFIGKVKVEIERRKNGQAD